MEEHYLKKELYSLIKEDDRIIDFLEEGTLDGMWYWDLEQPENEWMSPKLWQTFGLDPRSKKHLASEWQDLIHPEDLKMALNNFQEHCADPQKKYDQVVLYKHCKGHWVHIRCLGLVIRDDSGKPVRMLGAHTDVTELIHTQERLKSTNEDLTIFDYAASHDVRSPLKSLQGLFGILKKELSSEGLSRFDAILQLIEQRLGKMQNHIESVLDFATLEGELENKETVSLNKIFDDIEQEFKETESFRLTRLNDLHDVYGVKNLLFRLFLNLATNSHKFRKPSTPLEVTVATEQKNDHTLITFQDNGTGASKDQLEKIFGFFSKSHSEKENTGTGLGLAIVRKIVTMHGGEVWADSAPSQGMKTTISIPN